MSSRRLVNRGRENHESSPVQHSRHQEAEAVQQPPSLPPYEPPTCALTPSAKRAIEDLRANHDYTKYKKHIDESIKAITASIHESNDRVRIRKEDMARKANRQREGEDGEEDAGHEENAQEHVVRGMENKVASLTAKADKALRELIDYGDELSMRDTMLQEVSENIAAAPAPRPAARRQRRQGSHDDENAENESEDVKDENEEPEIEGSIVSAVELMKTAQEAYQIKYASKSLRLRYDTNDYRNFKRLVISGLKGPDAPVPHAKTWFAEDNQSGGARGDSNDDESDDDVIIERASISLKCPLTLQMFKEPYSNDKCKHVYEKSAILEFLDQNGTAFGRHGPKQIKCIQVGCETMLEASDFHLDTVLLRHVKQAARQAARELEEDDDDDSAPRGTQRNRPTQIEEEDDDDAIDVEAEQLRTIAKVKRERQQSRGLSQPQAQLDPDEIDTMDTD
ncbi:Non-structural maintenance of chromosomes element 2 [Hyphodiscus hymeniophilus]|uniref:Non-structural maintenance of chromosomes element 2 n=1 Tax=Hyphodiscus hymeniophilus TaxID=353542 RepID=A0A9P6VCJ9_9HELO|nr:Non-structural maintenance of chromosomes element 2 [Hyphodiscus hymeniophilus]